MTIFILYLSNNEGIGQNYILNIKIDSSEIVTYKTDSILINSKIDSIITNLRADNYWSAKVNYLSIIDSTANVNIQKGIYWEYIEINLDSLDSQIKNIAVPGKTTVLKSTYKQYNQIAKSILDYYQNHGYPFTIVQLKNIIINNGKIYASLFVDKKHLIRIDKINIITNYKFPPEIIYSTLKIKPNQIYNLEKIKKIKTFIDQLGYVKLTREPKFEFVNNKVTINLYLGKRPKNNFDLVLGLQKNNESEKNSYSIAGTANIELYNQIGIGEHIKAKYNQIKKGYKKIITQTVFPYIPYLPFGGEYDLRIYKRDTISLDLNQSIGALFNLGLYVRINASYEVYKSNLLSINKSTIITSHSLPANLDLSHKSFKTGIIYSKLNDFFNPSKGIQSQFNISFGKRRIEKNKDIIELKDPNNPEFDFLSLYENVKENSNIIKLTFNTDYYIPLFTRSAVRIGSYFDFINTEGTVFENETQKIGGHDKLRGFNEEEFEVSTSALLNVEYRFLLNRSSNIFAFIDGGYLKLNSDSILYPIGFGGGINLSTKTGLLGFTYGLGYRKNSGVNFRDSKIHLNYISYF